MTIEFEVIRHGTHYHLGEDRKIECPECGEEVDFQTNPPAVALEDALTDSQPGDMKAIFLCPSCKCVFFVKRKKEKK
jgi:predicted RNA-binding Zn-ribbon protein involved in translation (DUF1610 family)